MGKEYRLLRVDMPAGSRNSLEKELLEMGLCFLLDGAYISDEKAKTNEKTADHSRTDEKTIYHYVFKKSLDVKTQSEIIPILVRNNAELFSFQEVDEDYIKSIDNRFEKQA